MVILYSCSMKNIFRAIVTVIVFLGITVSTTSCSYQDPELKSFDGIEVIKMDGNTADIELNFTMNNPNRQKIKLKTAQFDIAINKIFIGVATLSEPTELPGNGEHKVQMKMNLELEKSIAELTVTLGFAILTNSLELQVDGSAKGSLGLFGKTFPIQHSEKVSWEDLKKLNY